MDERDQHAPRPARQAGGEGVFMTLISAAIFLYVGFGMGLAPFDSAPEPYRLATIGFVWMARIVGVGLLLVAVMGMMRVRGALMIECGLAGLAAAICLLTGAIWIYYGDNQGFLLLLFGLLNGSAARSALVRSP